MKTDRSSSLSLVTSRSFAAPHFVIPAKAGIQEGRCGHPYFSYPGVPATKSRRL